jgi:hypothetical protein
MVNDARSDEVRNRVEDAMKLLKGVVEQNPKGLIVSIDDARASLLLAGHYIDRALWALARIGH